MTFSKLVHPNIMKVGLFSSAFFFVKFLIKFAPLPDLHGMHPQTGVRCL